MSNTQDNNRPELAVEINTDPDVTVSVNTHRITQAVIAAARHRGFSAGQIGVRVTIDSSIQTLNRQYMGHDYPTDVISFRYQSEPPYLEGEMVVSAQTARDRASELGWPEEDELLLYIVHGTLHITGMDDEAPSDRQQMRQAEAEVLGELGVSGMERFGADVAGSLSSEETP